MDYVATLTLDYTGQRDNNEYNRILNALGQAGWAYAETSAMYIECDDLEPILLGMEILARAAANPGLISALALQVQLVQQPRLPPAARYHRRALDNILDRQLPSERL